MAFDVAAEAYDRFMGAWSRPLASRFADFAAIDPSINVVLANVRNVPPGRYRAARLTLISLAFLSSAGFLGLHALATPRVLLDSPNIGFAIATPVGLIIAWVFAAASATPLAGPRARDVRRG